MIRVEYRPAVPSPDGTPTILAAFDKFRGTLTAREACAATERAGGAAGVDVIACPLADGGEGTLDAVGGEAVCTTVTGPDHTPVVAEWRLLDAAGAAPTAVIEMARSSGLALAGGPEHNDPLAATTRGVGELVLAAIAKGCTRVVVGCGGSASTDGGAGALEVLDPAQLEGVDLYIAYDVETPFLDAARVFAPQKGAIPTVVDELTARLERLAHRYLDQFGVDVLRLAGAGAAGGLAGGLAALGGSLLSGFDLVAGIVGFPAALGRSDLVFTGEGRLDSTSLEGKVVGRVTALADGRVPVVVIAGDAEPGVLAGRDACAVVSLTERFGERAAHTATAELIARVVRQQLRAIGWP